MGLVCTRVLPRCNRERSLLMSSAKQNLALSLALLGATVCVPGQTSKEGQSTMTHPNGLTIAAPSKPLLSEQTQDGFRIQPQNWTHMRSPQKLLIELRSSPPAGEWPSTKKAGHETLHYRIDCFEGGSGGEERTLVAWKQVGAKVVWISESVQSETPADSDFEDGWKLLQTASIKKP